MNQTWLTVEETAKLCRLHPATIRKFSAEGRIDSRCGRKFGGRWRFRAEVIEREGLLLKETVQ